jgi:hypothetical protein
MGSAGGTTVTLLAIDPGTTSSGWVELNDRNEIIAHDITDNEELIDYVREFAVFDGHDLAIEMIASYGMPVGAEVFETCVWIGRMIQAYGGNGTITRVTRNQVKNHICGSSKAKDGNVRQALIDLFGPKGTKNAPGPTFGFHTHMWAALGVAATVRKLERKDTTT